MKKATYYLSAMLMAACFTQPAAAQFEGEITYNTYDYTDGSEARGDVFKLYITPERILLQGEKKYDFMESLKTEGVLVRLDSQDFVFLTGKNEALKIAKTDITSLMNMFGNNNGEALDEEYDIHENRTGETQTIKGYQCEKFIFRDEGDSANNYSEVWMTKEIDVNWGMLAEPWGDNNTNALLSDDLPMDLMFEENYFPIKLESYKDGELASALEATEIQKTSVDPAMVQVPSGIKVMTMQEYLFQKMSNR